MMEIGRLETMVGASSPHKNGAHTEEESDVPMDVFIKQGATYHAGEVNPAKVAEFRKQSISEGTPFWYNLHTEHGHHMAYLDPSSTGSQADEAITAGHMKRFHSLNELITYTSQTGFDVFLSEKEDHTKLTSFEKDYFRTHKGKTEFTCTLNREKHNHNHFAVDTKTGTAYCLWFRDEEEGVHKKIVADYKAREADKAPVLEYAKSWKDCAKIAKKHHVELNGTGYSTPDLAKK